MPEPSPQSTPDEKRRNFDAYLKARAQGSNVGLAELADRSDPDALATRLALLASENHFEPAADLVRGLPPHERWCNAAIRIFVQTGETLRARELVDWARGTPEKPARWQAYCAAFAESALQFLQMPPPTREKVVLQPGSLNGAQKALLSEAIEVLEPAAQIITLQGGVTNGLETAVAEVAFRCHYLLRHRSECQQYFRLLETRRPVSLLLAQSALVDWLEIDPPADLPARLRADHPDSREAKLRAATLEAATPGKQNEAFEALLPLLQEDLSPEERQEIAELLLALKSGLDPARRERCEQFLPNWSPRSAVTGSRPWPTQKTLSAKVGQRRLRRSWTIGAMRPTCIGCNCAPSATWPRAEDAGWRAIAAGVQNLSHPHPDATRH